MELATGEETYAALMAEYRWDFNTIHRMHPYWILVALGYRPKASEVRHVSEKDRLLADFQRRQQARGKVGKPRYKSE